MYMIKIVYKLIIGFSLFHLLTSLLSSTISAKSANWCKWIIKSRSKLSWAQLKRLACWARKVTRLDNNSHCSWILLWINYCQVFIFALINFPKSWSWLWSIIKSELSLDSVYKTWTSLASVQSLSGDCSKRKLRDIFSKKG